MILATDFRATLPSITGSNLDLTKEFRFLDARVFANEAQKGIWDLQVKLKTDTTSISKIQSQSSWKFDPLSGEKQYAVYATVNPADVNKFSTTVAALKAALQFATDSEIGFQYLDNKMYMLVPETEDDEDLLAQIGSSAVASDFYISLQGGSLRGSVESQDFEKVTDQVAGLVLYAEALSTKHPTYKFLSYWLILESAFNTYGENVALFLKRFCKQNAKPGQEFDIERLVETRNLCAHAAYRGGIEKLNESRHRAAEDTPMVKQLAEFVLTCKENWHLKDITSKTASLFPQRRSVREEKIKSAK